MSVFSVRFHDRVSGDLSAVVMTGLAQTGSG